MVGDIILYQTLHDRNNPKQIEEEGPFLCSREDAWLGEGYYFWEEFIENAHWWGQKGYSNKYVICQAKCNYDETICFDLHGNLKHLDSFGKTIKFLKKEGLIDEGTTVSSILDFIKRRNPEFVFQAIRVSGKYVKNKSSSYSFEWQFNPSSNKCQALDLLPPVQICIFEKTGLNLRDYKIIYP